MRNWLMRFMAGGNGADQFARFLSIAALVILILSMFLPGYVGTACMVIFNSAASGLLLFPHVFQEHREALCRKCKIPFH